MARLSDLRKEFYDSKPFPTDLCLDDILIVGDSFAASRNLGDWPLIFSESLLNRKIQKKETIRGKGITGASWWSARKILLSEVKKRTPKVLVMAHTEMQRIPHDENYALNSGSAFNIEHYSDRTKNIKRETVVPIEVLKAAQEYYTHLFSKDFHFWCQMQWFDEIDNLVKDYNIPYVIHLHSFMPWDNKPLHIFKYGITFDKALWPLSDDYYIMHTAPKKKVGSHEVLDADLWNNNPTTNHFTSENNKKLAELLISSLHTYQNGQKNFQL